MSTGIKLIEIALADLKAATALYEKKLFSQSYFSFQQASEKANKAYALFTELVQEGELKNGMGHNQLMPYRKAIVGEIAEMNHFNETLKNRPDIGQHNFLKNKSETFRRHSQRLQEGLKFHESSKGIDLLNLKREELSFYLENLNEIVNLRIRNLNKEAIELLNIELQEYNKFGNNFFSEEDRNELNDALKEEKREELKAVIVKSTNQMMNVIFIHVACYFCAIVTLRHSNTARYPDGETDPIQFYRIGNPLVDMQPQFMRFLKIALLRMKKLVLANQEMKGKEITE